MSAAILLCKVNHAKSYGFKGVDIKLFDGKMATLSSLSCSWTRKSVMQLGPSPLQIFAQHLIFFLSVKGKQKGTILLIHEHQCRMKMSELSNQSMGRSQKCIKEPERTT